MATTVISIETKADGTGIAIPSTTLAPGETLTCYAIGRDADGVFQENLAVTWSLQSIVDSIVSGDLVASGDSKSAVFTAALDGHCVIHIVSGAMSASTPTIWVVVAYAIASLSEVKAFLGDSGTDNDSFLIAAMKRLSSAMEGDLSQPIRRQLFEDIVDGSGTSSQLTNSARIISLYGDDAATRLANLQSRSGATESWADLVDDEDLIFVRESTWNVELLDGNIFPVGMKNVRIKYYGGFDPVPGDIKQWFLEVVQMMWNESGQGGNLLGKVSRNITEAGAVMNVGLKDLDDRWQKVRVRYQRLGYA
jgi:hypothetical protein